MPPGFADAVAPRHELFETARAGDDDAFGALVDAHRAELHAHCYRMLGSPHDAEDALQDAMLRAWRGLAGLEDEERLRPWLYKIATNTCLDTIRRRPRRVLPMEQGSSTEGTDAPEEPLDAAIWIEPYPDASLVHADRAATPEARYEQREAVELAFVTALQQLPGRQRAVLVLREVLAFSAREAAELLDTTVPAVNSALQRARKTVNDRVPEESQQSTLRSLGDDRVRDFVARFMDAFEAGDVDAILGMLAEDATFTMPPYPGWYRGREAIADSWLMPSGSPPRLRYVPTRANGQLAFGAYLLDADAGVYRPLALDVVTLRGAEIVDVIAFRTPGVLRAFGLPEVLQP